jgi:hypothetical protein
MLFPNADFCKFVIWCVAAGFSEKLVPSQLTVAAGKELS